ncbi:MAG TPA: chemotaxis protein CheW [Prolixibacteraceae bacterium]
MKTENRVLLKKRAVEMAKEPELKTEGSEYIGIITFSLSDENYGIETEFVSEVYHLKEFTPLPGVPAYILGVINVRGKILEVIDLKKLFNLPDKGIGELNKVIILRNEQMEFGILADVVHGIQIVAVEDIRAVTSTVSGIGEEYLKGVTKEHLIILNADNLLSDKSIVVNEEIH